MDIRSLSDHERFRRSKNLPSETRVSGELVRPAFCPRMCYGQPPEGQKKRVKVLSTPNQDCIRSTNQNNAVVEIAKFISHSLFLSSLFLFLVAEGQVDRWWFVKGKENH